MSVILTRQFGSTLKNPTMDDLRAELAGLDLSEQEHIGCSVHDESGWCLAYSIDGTVTFENIENRGFDPRHLRHVTHEQVLGLWSALADGRLDRLHGLLWRPGYGF
jgi:hypothetical protein